VLLAVAAAACSLLVVPPPLPLLCLLCACRYVYQGHHDNQGQFWVYVAHRVVICLGVMAAFTAGASGQLWVVPAGVLHVLLFGFLRLGCTSTGALPPPQPPCKPRLPLPCPISLPYPPARWPHLSLPCLPTSRPCRRVSSCLPGRLPAAVLAVRGAYTQGLVLLITSVVYLVWFDRQVPAAGPSSRLQRLAVRCATALPWFLTSALA
jgi:hypothetical protein